ncbi:LysR family transcriptional regulator [Massilia sp. H-1]|nr:LysR family transcriptional regulator [Massilia sp. H-1]
MASLDHIDLNSLTFFDCVVEAGSFTGAADRLGVAKAKVSVQIARLERQLGVSLFTRTTRQVTLTDAGRALHDQCQPLLRGLSDALAEAGNQQGELSGMLRISTTALQASQTVGPALVEFAALHPRLQIDLRTGDKVADMVAEGIDLSFRMGWLRDSTQRAIKLRDFSQFVVASPRVPGSSAVSPSARNTWRSTTGCRCRCSRHRSRGSSATRTARMSWST